MQVRLLIFLCWLSMTYGNHFNGGTIRWTPIDPFDNSTSVGITITQSYSWTYPVISCANDVPISTTGRANANANLTCIALCSTDGGYSSAPIDILTDCTSFNSTLGVMKSQRSKNITLTADAHFYLAYQGSAWVPLSYPPHSGLGWSIVTYIDLRRRPDGSFNTPPDVQFTSPIRVDINTTTNIPIPVSDVNTGDDVRCRWATQTTVYGRRRRQSGEEEDYQSNEYDADYNRKLEEGVELHHIRKKRSCTGGCITSCSYGCDCSCSSCDPSICINATCSINSGCTFELSTSMTEQFTELTTGMNNEITTTSTIDLSTLETGTVQTTTSHAVPVVVDECNGACYSTSLPAGTNLSNCTITFTSTRGGVWYAVALQIEDFINTTSTTPMSSVPVQILIYVEPPVVCTKVPIIFPLNGCLEVQVGVAVSFNISTMNLCNASLDTIDDLIVVSNNITNITRSNLTSSQTNSSIFYVQFDWTPDASDIGLQQLCTTSVTMGNLVSTIYCVTFTVITSSATCPTTTTSTSSTSTSETTTSATTSTSTSSTTSTSTSSTTSSSTTSTTSSSTSSTTSSSSSSTTTSTTTSSTTSTTTTSTATTTTTSSTTSTTSTTATTTTFTTSTGGPINTSDNSSLVFGLGLGLGLALLLALSILIGCILCYIFPGLFRKRIFRKVRDHEHDDPEAGRKQRASRSSIRNRKNLDNDLDDYRRMYINDSLRAPPTDLFNENSFFADSSSPLNISSQIMTHTTFMAPSPMISASPRPLKMEAVPPVELSFLETGGSMLVHAYMMQEQSKSQPLN